MRRKPSQKRCPQCDSILPADRFASMDAGCPCRDCEPGKSNALPERIDGTWRPAAHPQRAVFKTPGNHDRTPKATKE